MITDYKIEQKEVLWYIRVKWFTIPFINRIVWTNLKLNIVKRDIFGSDYISTYTPKFYSFETAILAAEFVKDNEIRRYKGFELIPIYNYTNDFTVDTDRRKYALIAYKFRIGTYLELRSLIDELYDY